MTIKLVLDLFRVRPHHGMGHGVVHLVPRRPGKGRMAMAMCRTAITPLHHRKVAAFRDIEDVLCEHCLDAIPDI